MNKKLNKVMSAILEGRKKTVDAYKEYKDLVLNKSEIISFDYNSLVNKKHDEFIVKLYNYVNAIRNKKSYFEKYGLIEEKLNYIPEELKGKNLYLLLKAFRHKNEHPENIEYEDDYILCKEYITFEILEELLKISNYVLEYEFKNYEENTILQIILSNPDLRLGAKRFYNKMLEASKIEDENYPEVYKYNQEVMTKLSSFNFENMTFDSLENIMEELQPYISNPIAKELIRSTMSEKSYSQFERLTDLSEDINVEDYVKEFEKLFNSMKEDKKVGI